VNSANAATPFVVTFTSVGFATNGIQNGGLTNPLAANFSGNADMAIPTATQDYVYTTATINGPVITLSGLNPSKQYVFKIFGSRSLNSVRTSQYTIVGSNTVVGTLNSSTASGANSGTVYTSDYVFPTSSGNITITTVALAGGFAYINALKVEEYDANLVNTTSIAIVGNNITSFAAPSQMSVVYTPTNATPKTINWSVDDANIATISSTGLLSPLKNGIVTVTASLVQNGLTISATKQITVSNQFSAFYVSGTATSNGDNQATALQMNAPVGISGIMPGVYELSLTLKASGTLKFYSSQTDMTAPVIGAGATAGTLAVGGNAITPSVSGPVLIRVYLATNTFRIYPINVLKISQMGSSVSNGYGATSNHGYAWDYTQLLVQGFTAGTGLKWTLSNISVNGNATTDLLNRWDTDLLNDNSKYVIYALSLGNEGIIGGGQPIFNQFKTNMLLLISKARSVGKIPVVANNYSRSDYTSVEYNYIKQMNLLIHTWDVPSINLLGAVDDGTGKWVVTPINYRFDNLHPNDIGHLEMSYAIVPSLFDALNAGKPLPQLNTNTYLSTGKSTNSDKLVFTPENIIHSFTVSIDIKTTSNGTIASFKQATAFGTVNIAPATGCLTYTSPNGGTITGTVAVNDGLWHKITLTHYYAWGKTILYNDNNEAGRITENLIVTNFYLNDTNSPSTIDYRNWFFYRSGMNADEITALNSGKILKSSLELYAPLDGQKILSSDTLINLAQSTNTINRIGVSTGINSLSNNSNIKIYPNPVNDKLKITGLKSDRKYDCTVYGTDGRIVLNTMNLKNNILDVSELPSNIYIILLKNKLDSEQVSLRFQKVKNTNN
jgi:lysophospholipase L1-like esterase